MTTHSIFLPQETQEQYEKAKNMTSADDPPRLEGVWCASREEKRAITNSSRKNEAAGPTQKQHSFVDVSGGYSKVWCYTEEYIIGTWNIRSMNKGKLDVVKQEMAKVSIDILRIRELKWTEMGKFNSDDHYFYHCVQESIEEKE